MKITHKILPQNNEYFSRLGENIKLARLRRKLTTVQMAERSGLSRSTVFQIEKGSPTVAMGSYFSVLSVLNLEESITKIAFDDQYGRMLQDIGLNKHKTYKQE